MQNNIFKSSLSLLTFLMIESNASELALSSNEDQNITLELSAVTPRPGIDYTNTSQFLQTKNTTPQLSQINAQVAHNNGFTGGNLSKTQTYKKVSSDSSNRNLQTIVAVLDSGVNINHDDLKSKGKIEAFKDFTNAKTVAYDNFGHGTMVSSIIAGDRQSGTDPVYGIAYGANLIEGQILTSTGTSNSFLLQQGIDWVVQQKKILDVKNVKQVVSLNLSIGSNNSSFVNTGFKNSLLNALNSGLSIVSAAGNEGLDCKDNGTGINGNCSFPAAVPWVNSSDTNSFLNKSGAWVVVGSVDKTNTISKFSNKAGVTKSNYIVAPGENVIGASNKVNNGYMAGSGTSFAAPLVSGALALFAQKWPYLQGKQHAQIMFDTATDLGDKGIDDVYGNGLLNLTKAFNPVGTIMIPTGASNVFTTSKQSTTNTSLKTSSALSLKSLTLDNNIVIDSYNRDFSMSLSNAVTTTGLSPVDFNNFMTLNYGNVLMGVDQSRNMFMLGYKFNDNSKLKVSYDNSFLGTQSDGALLIGNANSVYVNYDKNLINVNDFVLNMNGTYAYAEANTASNSVITDLSSVQAIGGEVTAMYKGFGLGYEIPLRTVSGSASLNTATSVDSNGNLIYSQDEASLNPDSFQQVFSAFYQKQMKNINFEAKVSRTNDAYSIKNLVSNDLKISLNYFY